MFKRIRRVLVLAVFLFAGYKAYRVHQDVKQVMTYQPMVREILSEKDTPANEELVLAMIYTETKGKEGDVMQSSESASGSTNTINDNASSIRQGVQTLTDNLYLAQKKGLMSGRLFKPIILDLPISILSPKTARKTPWLWPNSTLVRLLLPCLAIPLERLIVIFTPFPFFMGPNSM